MVCKTGSAKSTRIYYTCCVVYQSPCGTEMLRSEHYFASKLLKYKPEVKIVA